jgi:hypothetical protein
LSFVAAIDDAGDLEYLSILVGEREKLESIAKTIPTGFSHLTHHDERTKKDILKQFNLSGNIQICCLRFGYGDLVSEFERKSKGSGDVTSIKMKFYNNLAIEAKANWNSLFKDFLYSNKLYLHDLVFEIDNGLIKNILKRNGIKFRQPSKIHKIADCIVHANFKNWSVEGVNEYNTEFYKDDFRSKVIRRCFR